MRKIKTVIDYVKDEMADADKYIKQAGVARVDGDEKLYSTAIDLANAELSHAMKWHEVVEELITKAQAYLASEEKEVPQYMLDMWNEKHNWYLERMAELKYKLDMIKK